MAKFTRADIRKIVGEACTDDMENSLISLHLSVVDGLKDDIDRYKTKAEKAEQLEKDLDAAKKDGDYKAKYEKEHADFEAYKKSVDAEKTSAAKEKAAKAFFEGKGITGANLEIALRGAKDEIAAIELDGEKIKDTKALDTLVGGTFKGLIVTQTAAGVNTANPPAGNGHKLMSREEIYKKDDKGRYVLDATERQKALAELITNEQKE